MIGAALTAAVILAPATTFARDHHEPRPANGIQLAADIVNLVRAVVEPRPAPVVVETAPTVVKKTVVVETTPTVVEKTVVVETKPVVVATTQKVVTAVPGTVIVTGAEEVAIPEYDYVLYEDEYIPYYEGWLFYRDEWHWVGAEHRPAPPPRWTPPPRHPDHKPHKVIVLPEKHHAPAPAAAHRHEEPRHAPAPAVRHEAPRREPAHTIIVRPDKKEAPRGEAPKTVRPDKKEADHGAPRKHDAPPAGKR